MRTRIVLALALALVFAAGAAAQQIEPIIYVADFHVQPGKEGDFLDVVNKYHAPAFDKLVADGAVLAWGVDVPILHEPGAATHSAWWAMPNVGALDAVFAAIEELGKKMDADGARARFMGAIDLSKHRDFLFREIVTGSGAPPAKDSKPYLWLTVGRIQPGKSDEFRKLWVEYFKPTYDKLVADGVINSYALGIEEVKTTDDFTHYVAVTLPNLAARDKAKAAFDAAMAARTPADRSIMTNSLNAVVDLPSLRNLVLRSIIFRAAAPPK
ncbi:MAG: hypothetical protein L0212_10085 [Acidobacteria bacterium]|nr:hypothetical protein [Acidobacteriota bacterium]